MSVIFFNYQHLFQRLVTKQADALWNFCILNTLIASYFSLEKISIRPFVWIWRMIAMYVNYVIFWHNIIGNLICLNSCSISVFRQTRLCMLNGHCLVSVSFICLSCEVIWTNGVIIMISSKFYTVRYFKFFVHRWCFLNAHQKTTSCTMVLGPSVHSFSVNFCSSRHLHLQF